MKVTSGYRHRYVSFYLIRADCVSSTTVIKEQPVQCAGIHMGWPGAFGTTGNSELLARQSGHYIWLSTTLPHGELMHTHTHSLKLRDKGCQLTEHETKSFHIHRFTQRAVLCETIPGFGITFAVSFLLVFYHFNYCVYINLESETSKFDSWNVFVNWPTERLWNRYHVY